MYVFVCHNELNTVNNFTEYLKKLQQMVETYLQ